MYQESPINAKFVFYKCWPLLASAQEVFVFFCLRFPWEIAQKWKDLCFNLNALLRTCSRWGNQVKFTTIGWIFKLSLLWIMCALSMPMSSIISNLDEQIFWIIHNPQLFCFELPWYRKAGYPSSICTVNREILLPFVCLDFWTPHVLILACLKLIFPSLLFCLYSPSYSLLF